MNLYVSVRSRGFLWGVVFIAKNRAAALKVRNQLRLGHALQTG